MNLLAMMTLAVLVPSADAENADVWVRVSSSHVEIFATAEDAKAVLKKSGEGIFVECTSMKINVTAEGNVFEFENCVFHTSSSGRNGKAKSGVFDQAKRVLTLTGDEISPVQWLIQSDKNGDPKSIIISKSMQINILSSELGTPRDRIRPTPDPIGGGPTRSGLFQDIASPSRDEPTRSSETE
jgi:hypothetical protein